MRGDRGRLLVVNDGVFNPADADPGPHQPHLHIQVFGQAGAVPLVLAHHLGAKAHPFAVERGGKAKMFLGQVPEARADHQTHAEHARDPAVIRVFGDLASLQRAHPGRSRALILFKKFG